MNRVEKWMHEIPDNFVNEKGVIICSVLSDGNVLFDSDEVEKEDVPKLVDWLNKNYIEEV